MFTIIIITYFIVLLYIVQEHIRYQLTYSHVLLSVTVTHPSMNQCVELMDSPMPLPAMLAVQLEA